MPDVVGIYLPWHLRSRRHSRGTETSPPNPDKFPHPHSATLHHHYQLIWRRLPRCSYSPWLRTQAQVLCICALWLCGKCGKQTITLPSRESDFALLVAGKQSSSLLCTWVGMSL